MLLLHHTMQKCDAIAIINELPFPRAATPRRILTACTMKASNFFVMSDTKYFFCIREDNYLPTLRKKISTSFNKRKLDLAAAEGNALTVPPVLAAD